MSIAGSEAAVGRETLSLDGVWDFHFGGDVAVDPATITAWRAAVVPMPWQAQFDDLRNRAGRAWYRRYVVVPASWQDSRVILRFGAVNYFARVIVNGVEIGCHEGGYLPFEFDIASAVRFGGRTEILVQVIAPLDDPALYPDFPFAETPFGKQSWYGFLSGLWQSVRLERRAPVQLMPPRIRADLNAGTVHVQADLSQPTQEASSVLLEVEAPDGAIAAVLRHDLPIGQSAIGAVLTLSDVRAWSPDDPALYCLRVTLQMGDATDCVLDQFGFRTIEAREGRLYLNGLPIYLRAALDQDYYPDTISTVPSEGFLEDQFRKAKALGLNCLRCHIKAPDPRYYALADRVGLLIWNDLPNCGRLTAKAAERAQATLRGIIDRDGNHPSIIAWTIINENWGTDLVHDPDHRAWLKEMYAWTKAYDPTRLVVDNSPLWPSGHVVTDIEDIHFYTAVPDHRRAWDRFVAAFAARELETFVDAPEVLRKGGEPLIVSEFGNWGLPDPAQLRDAEGREPWWFESGHDWGEGITYPHGIETRFSAAGLDRVFGSLRGFVEAAQWQQFAALKYQIEVMRAQPEVAGYVITELTDCHWEANGLLDMRRNPRVFHHVFPRVNADIVAIARAGRDAYWAGERAQVELFAANGGALPIVDAELRWSLDGAAGRETLDIPIAGVAPARAASFTVPDFAQAAIHRFEVELSVAGRVLATNAQELAIFPRREGPAWRGTVWATTRDWRDRLASLGYALADSPERAGVIVCERLDEDICARIRLGARVLLVADDAMALQPVFPHWQNVRVLARENTPWQADWASSFSWLRREGPFAALPGGPLLDHAFERVIAQHVISGCNVLDFQARVHAGMVVGWIHKPVALVVERDYGKGRLVATTLRLAADAPGVDPVATTLLDALVALTRARHGAALPAAAAAVPA